MLVLSRRIHECVIINDNIIIKVLGVKGNQVRLGFEAPADVVIHREEIAEQIQASAFVQKKKVPAMAYRNRPLQRPVSHQVLL